MDFPSVRFRLLPSASCGFHNLHNHFFKSVVIVVKEHDFVGVAGNGVNIAFLFLRENGRAINQVKFVHAGIKSFNC